MSSDNREKDLELIKEKLKELDIPVGEVVVEKILPETEKQKIVSGEPTTKQRPRFLDKIVSFQKLKILKILLSMHQMQHLLIIQLSKIMFQRTFMVPCL